MGRSQETFNKKEKEKKRLKKKQEKLEKRAERKANAKKSTFESMMGYVDEFGNITDTPPDPMKKKKVNAESIELGVPKREKEPLITERKGSVEFFNDSKGYGFIKESDTHEKYFFHVNGLIDEVEENDKVIFELEKGQKGMNAVRVKKA